MKLRYLAAIGLAGTLGLAACGSSSNDSGSGGTTAAPSPETAAPDASAAAGTTIRLWLNGEDTKQELVDYAIAEFNKLHPDVKVKFERQQWTGIVEKLTTPLSSSDSPDVVELGNTQAQAFEAAGALADLTDKKAELGGDDLLQSLVEAGTYDGKFYGVPYYARRPHRRLPQGPARAVGPRRSRPRLDEFVAAGIKLKQDNAATPNFSGIYFPGKYWYAALPFIWQEGGDIAVQDGGAWKGTLSSPESVKGLADGQEDHGRGIGRAEGRRRDQGLRRLLQRRGRHADGPGLEDRPDPERGGRLPRHGGQDRRLRPARR